LYSKWNIHSEVGFCPQAAMKRKVKEMTGEMKKIQQDMETLQGSFMDIGNVTMVSVFVENSQIQKAVDLQRHTNCEMQLNFNVNVHVAVHSSTFERNKKRISLSEHPVCVPYTVDIHTQKDTHGPIVSAAHSAVTLHIPHSPTDTLHTVNVHP